MNVTTALRRRKLGLTGKIDIDFAIYRILRLKDAFKLEQPIVNDANMEEDLSRSGPLASTKLINGIIAVANEDGFMNLLQTAQLKEIASWEGHENAIFDIKASLDSKSLFSASGDATIKYWDVETRKLKERLQVHDSSIKSISIFDNSTLASGSRDGTIKVHDLRSNKPTVTVIRDAHKNRLISKNRRASVKTDPTSVVTNIAFDPHFPKIYSTGANDATIKLWDLRKTTQTNKPRRNLIGQLLINQPNIEVHHPVAGKHCGYSHLLLSSRKVYAACSDNKIYCYDNFGSNDAPIKFTGYHYDTYLKMAIMDDRFLFSGSKSGGALMWSLGTKHNSSMYIPDTTRHPIGQLKPDLNDTNDTNVIETDWDSLSIFTFRDDRVVFKWTMQHVLESERRNLANSHTLNTTREEQDVTIEMSDIIDVNILRPNYNTMLEVEKQGDYSQHYGILEAIV